MMLMQAPSCEETGRSPHNLPIPLNATVGTEKMLKRMEKKCTHTCTHGFDVHFPLQSGQNFPLFFTQSNQVFLCLFSSASSVNVSFMLIRIHWKWKCTSTNNP